MKVNFKERAYSIPKERQEIPKMIKKRDNNTNRFFIMNLLNYYQMLS